MVEKVLVTGANGHLGKKLILASKGYEVCALVRSEEAESDLKDFINGHSVQNVEIVKCNYLDLSVLRQLVLSCTYVVHLVGILKETKENNFDLAHKQTSEVLIEALLGSKVEKVCYISILGSKENSRNSCFSSWVMEVMVILLNKKRQSTIFLNRKYFILFFIKSAYNVSIFSKTNIFHFF